MKTARKAEILRSYSETLVEISILVGQQYEKISCILNDHVEINNLCIEWAEIFEARNAKREWDGEWLEEVETYTNEMIDKTIEIYR